MAAAAACVPTRQLSGPARAAIACMLDCAEACVERAATEDEARAARAVCCNYAHRTNQFVRCSVIVPVEYKEEPAENGWVWRFCDLHAGALKDLAAPALEQWEKENPEWESTSHYRPFERPVNEVTVIKLVDPYCAGYVTSTPDKFIGNHSLMNATLKVEDIEFRVQSNFAGHASREIGQADPHEQAQLKAMHFANFSRVVIRRMEQLMEEQLAAAQKELATYTESAAAISSTHKRNVQDESGEEERKKSRTA